MTFKRLVRWVNAAILIAVLAGAALVWWYAWRPLPKTSGTIETGVGARVRVDRDALGVPHISAGSIEDALFVQGYVTAQDRMWQMDALRRVAAGRIAEIAGPVALESDRDMHRLRLERIAEQEAGTLAAADRAVLAAYARGVNSYLEDNRGRLPVEFAFMGYDPRPWRTTDSLVIGLYMYAGLSSTWRKEIAKGHLLEGGDAAKVNELYPARAGTEIQPGSNAWVLAGRHSASGKPLLSNDPHLEYSIPGIWHAVHLRAPGLNVAGVALPGVPCVIIGHNDRIGWGLTNLHFDVQDLYVEKLDAASGRYVFRGQGEQARLERDVLPVKGARPLEFAQWVTRHGPVFADGNRLIAVRWAAAEPGSGFPLLDLDRARDWRQFTAALARYPGPAQNFVYADVDGNIGYHASGRLPVRKNYAGDAPVDGSSGNFEWDGFIPFDELPSSYNPASGVIVTANQDPFPADYAYAAGGNFTSPYRANQIAHLLGARGGWTAEQMLGIQTDVYSGFCHFLARQAVAAYDRRGANGAGLAPAISVLRAWNGQMEIGRAAPVIAMLLYEHLLHAMGERASPGKGLQYDPPMPSGGDSVQIAPAVVEELLRARPKNWFGDYDELLLRSLAAAVEEGRRIWGRNIEKWDWGQSNRLLIEHPVLSRLPFAGGYFNIGPVAQSGSTTTVKQTTRRLGPSMRMTVDFAALDRSRLNLPAGESGHPLSSHYKDQWAAYYYGRSFPMEFENVGVKSSVEFVPR